MATDAVQMRPVLQDLALRLWEACKAGEADAAHDLVGVKTEVNARDAVQYCLT